MTSLHNAVRALRAGELVVIPTDTVYGIAAVPTDPRAVSEVFAVKGRPPDKALPILGADMDQLKNVARFDERAERLAARFWPGPLTLVLPRAAGFVIDLGGVDDRSIAVRVPASEVARSLLSVTGPLAVTSANLSGRSDSATVDAARDALGESISVYVDDGPGRGRPSTIVSLVDEPIVLRVGALEPDELESLL